MTLPIKPRRVDFWASDWLGGTVALSLAERGLYITACAMIYDAGGPIHKAELRRVVAARNQTFNSVLLMLVDKGKLQLRDGMIDQVRCEREIARARRRMTKTLQSVNQTVRSVAFSSPPVLNETNNLTPSSRAGPCAEVYQANKERSKILGDRGVAALPSEPAPPPEREPAETAAGPPTPEQVAEVDALVQQATAALRGGVPKGIRDAAAYGAAIKDAKFANLVKSLNAWVGTGLDGEARMSAWEVLAAAEKAGARSGMTRATRRNFDKLDRMHRATGPPDDMAQAA